MHLSFIWHMHQPDYRDSSGIMQMPWVFLHAIKDYYDMPWMLSRHEGLKATFNITPPLIEQVSLYYENPQESDKFIKLWLQHPDALEESDYKWIIKLCKSTPYETMVLPMKSYARLYEKEHYNCGELMDMEVLFVLSWCGEYLRQNSKIVKALLKKEHNYTQEDKYLLLNELTNFIKGIFDYYAKLYHEGTIALSTTPLNHPILPLLMDMNNAAIANKNTNLPKQHMPLSEDAKLQVERAVELFERTFGFKAVGFWPAEGAVDEKSVKLLGQNGIKWIATDEAILFKSLGNNDRKNLYSAYNYNGMVMGFRDHGLSDLIGFTYRFWDEDKAAEHFINTISSINTKDSEASVFVILDGENAWEFYKNNGFDFFEALYSKLNTTPWCKTLHMEEVMHLPSKPLKKLSPGSWIHAEFNTWVGHREKTRGWELIYLTKRDFEHHRSKLDEETVLKITEHFLAAECSDWFWWYGDDHYTEFSYEYDHLFRSHLIEIYALMHIAPPSDLLKPIITNQSSQNFLLQPSSSISPNMNGDHDSFFEWVGSGVLDETKVFSTMDKVRGPVRKILFGQDDARLYFAFSADKERLKSCDIIRIIIDPIGYTNSIALSNVSINDDWISFANKEWLEISINKDKIDSSKVQVRFELYSRDDVVQILPGFGELSLDLDTDYSENWFV